jgi:hypothetical protein
MWVLLPVGGVYLYTTIRDGFDLIWTVFAAALGLFMFVVYEWAFKRSGWIEFQSAHLVVNSYEWGQQGRSEEALIPYEAISQIDCSSDGEIELRVTDVELPWEITGSNPRVTFRPRKVRVVLDELYHHVDAAKSLVVDRRKA